MSIFIWNAREPNETSNGGEDTVILDLHFGRPDMPNRAWYEFDNPTYRPMCKWQQYHNHRNQGKVIHLSLPLKAREILVCEMSPEVVEDGLVSGSAK